MISTRDIKRKIRTVRNLQQMCRAMKTVSLVKLQKAEARLAAARPYAAGMARGLARLAAALEEEAAVGPVPHGNGAGTGEKAVAVITSDKGLCGGYNSSILRRAQQEAKDAGVIAVGRKGERFFRRRGFHIIDSLSPLGSEPTFAQVASFADGIARRVEGKEISSLSAVHGRFLHGTRSEVAVRFLLPVEKMEEEVILEPPPREMAQLLLRRHLRAALYAAVLEGSASEHGARVAAMTAASDNAEEMIHDLVMDYNKARQASITKELTEIVGSAEALR